MTNRDRYFERFDAWGGAGSLGPYENKPLTPPGVGPLSCDWFESVCPGEPRVEELAAFVGGCRWVSRQPDEDCPPEEEWEGFGVEDVG